MTGLEPIWIGTAAKELTDIAVKSVSEVLNQRPDKSFQQLLFNVIRKYIENYSDRHGLLKVLGMPEHVNLEDIYTTVQFLDSQSIWQFDPNRLEEAYRKSQERRFQSKECERQDGLKVANEQQYLMVLGQAGAGKSTFLRWIGWESLKGQHGGYQHKCIPVFLELKQFRTGEIDLEQAIAHELEICGFPDPVRSTQKFLINGKLLILLDGLDEIPTQQLEEARVNDKIRDFADQYKQNRFIASCRTAALQDNFNKFRNITVADFDDDQIEQFINNWFHTEKDRQANTAYYCWKLLQSPKHSATKELAQTPLLLTLLCLVYNDKKNFPEKRAELYKVALDLLINKWANQVAPIYKDLSLKLETSILCAIAYQSFSSNQLFFLKQEVVDQIYIFLASQPNISGDLTDECVLQALQDQGILVERTKNVLSFSHLTLQEYLCAQYIANQSQTNKAFITQLLKKHFTDRRWREVWLLLAGLTRGSSDSLLLQMEQQAQTHLTTPTLQTLLDWADRETQDSESNYKPVVKRTLAVLLVLTRARACNHAHDIRAHNCARALGYDLALACGLDIARVHVRNSVLDLALWLDLDLDIAFKTIKIFKSVNFSSLISELKSPQTSTFSTESSQEKHLHAVNQHSRIWCNALHLDPECLNLSGEELDALNDYLYTNELILRCKEAAVRVSSQIRAGIEARMLTLNSLPIQDQDPITQPKQKIEQLTTNSATQIPHYYDLRGATIGNWAENQYGSQQTIQIPPSPNDLNPPESPESPQ
jgi:hypothetical protein